MKQYSNMSAFDLNMNNYKIGKRISDGAFGTVFEAKKTPDNKDQTIPQTVAVKQVYTSSNNVQRELYILQKLPKHPNIVEIYSVFKENFTTNIVMQKGKCDLLQWINQNYYPIPQKTVKAIAYQILEGLKVVHQANIIHRDLKPSNLVIRQNNQIAICDFGSAVQCTKGQEYEIQGFTRWYKSPEMLFGYRKYKYQVDIWSVGCILMEVATGEPLFNSKSEIQQLSMIAQLLGDPSPQNWPLVAKMPDYNKINFKKIKPKTNEELAKQWSISLQLCQFVKKLVCYQGRKSVKQLLKDDFFKDLDLQWAPFESKCSELRAQHKLLLQEGKKKLKV